MRSGVRRRASGAGGKTLFLGGAAQVADVARLRLGAAPHVAFAGRSNVGKSSLLNALAGERIARVSADPGRTREINFFLWKGIVLADLPGYGYAKVSRSERERWGREITAWLESETRLALVIALVDGRHGFQPLDLELLGFLRDLGRRHLVVFTKMDKWKSSSQRARAESLLSARCAEAGISDFAFVSAVGKSGAAALVRRLRGLGA